MDPREGENSDGQLDADAPDIDAGVGVSDAGTGESSVFDGDDSQPLSIGGIAVAHEPGVAVVTLNPVDRREKRIIGMSPIAIEISRGATRLVADVERERSVRNVRRIILAVMTGLTVLLGWEVIMHKKNIGAPDPYTAEEGGADGGLMSLEELKELQKRSRDNLQWIMNFTTQRHGTGNADAGVGEPGIEPGGAGSDAGVDGSDREGGRVRSGNRGSVPILHGSCVY